jgi:hypothetical protein
MWCLAFSFDEFVRKFHDVSSWEALWKRIEQAKAAALPPPPTASALATDTGRVLGPSSGPQFGPPTAAAVTSQAQRPSSSPDGREHRRMIFGAAAPIPPATARPKAAVTLPGRSAAAARKKADVERLGGLSMRTTLAPRAFTAQTAPPPPVGPPSTAPPPTATSTSTSTATTFTAAATPSPLLRRPLRNLAQRQRRREADVWAEIDREARAQRAAQLLREQSAGLTAPTAPTTAADCGSGGGGAVAVVAPAAAGSPAANSLPVLPVEEVDTARNRARVRRASIDQYRSDRAYNDRLARGALRAPIEVPFFLWVPAYARLRTIADMTDPDRIARRIDAAATRRQRRRHRHGGPSSSAAASSTRPVTMDRDGRAILRDWNDVSSSDSDGDSGSDDKAAARERKIDLASGKVDPSVRFERPAPHLLVRKRSFLKKGARERYVDAQRQFEQALRVQTADWNAQLAADQRVREDRRTELATRARSRSHSPERQRPRSRSPFRSPDTSPEWPAASDSLPPVAVAGTTPPTTTAISALNDAEAERRRAAEAKRQAAWTKAMNAAIVAPHYDRSGHRVLRRPRTAHTVAPAPAAGDTEETADFKSMGAGGLTPRPPAAGRPATSSGAGAGGTSAFALTAKDLYRLRVSSASVREQLLTAHQLRLREQRRGLFHTVDHDIATSDSKLDAMNTMLNAPGGRDLFGLKDVRRAVNEQRKWKARRKRRKFKALFAAPTSVTSAAERQSAGEREADREWALTRSDTSASHAARLARERHVRRALEDDSLPELWDAVQTDVHGRREAADRAATDEDVRARLEAYLDMRDWALAHGFKPHRIDVHHI